MLFAAVLAICDDGISGTSNFEREHDMDNETRDILKSMQEANKTCLAALRLLTLQSESLGRTVGYLNEAVGLLAGLEDPPSPASARVDGKGQGWLRRIAALPSEPEDPK